MTSILQLQYRLTPLQDKGKSLARIMNHPDFSLALDFLHLRALVDTSLNDAFLQWQEGGKKSAKKGGKEKEVTRRKRSAKKTRPYP